MYFLVLPQQSSQLGLHGPVLLCLLGDSVNIAPAGRAIRRNDFYSITLLGKPIIEVKFLDIYIVCTIFHCISGPVVVIIQIKYPGLHLSRSNAAIGWICVWFVRLVQTQGT